MRKYIIASLTTILIVSILLAVGMLVFYYRQKPSDEVISFSDEIYLVYEDEIFNDNVFIIEDDIIYLLFNFIKEEIDPNIFYDENDEMLIITDREKVLRYTIKENKATINHREFTVDYPVRKIDGKIYIPEDIISKQYELNINYWEDTNAITVDKLYSDYVEGLVMMEGGNIRTNFDVKSPIVYKDVEVDTNLFIYEEYEDWFKVRTIDGIIGFIQKDYVKIDFKDRTYNMENTAYIEEKPKEKINLTWDYTYRKLVDVGDINPIHGLNVLSPTWFSIVNEKGEIYDKGNKDYVSEYKDLGYEIWPLIDNGTNPDLTSEVLSSSIIRERLIREIFLLYDEYGVDGINIDFENIYLKDRDLLTQFVRELYPVFKEKGMVVSIDVTPISLSENWSMCYDRKRLSESVDYMILMAYDQHWASSPVAGSVAQYTWVEKSLKEVLKEVPNNKLILGIPFYTRLWTIEEGENGEKVTSNVLTMEGVKDFIESNGIVLNWDEESGQYYGEIEKEGKTYKIWVENEDSLKLKASLVNKYNLAGIASWRKGFEEKSIWPVLSQTINLN